MQLLLLALMHGLLYALLLPPWGLIDEPQHVHYIQSLAERGVSPVAGHTLLSPDIIDSLFETQRWETFHWPTPPTRNAQTLGAVGHSYEAYHPPLFYLLLAPIYTILPHDILDKVYLLRIVVVLLSLLTLYVAWRTARLLAPDIRSLPILAGFLLVAIPERTYAVSRINNDVLVELLAAIFVYQWTRAALDRLSLVRSLYLALLLILGVYTKFSMLLLVVPLLMLWWPHRHHRSAGYLTVLTVILVSLSITPLVLYNLWLYDSITGFAAFEKLYHLEPPGWSWMALGNAVVALFAHMWMIWWKGSEAVRHPVVLLTAATMAIVVVFSLGRVIGGSLVRQQESKKRDFVLLVYVATIIVYGLSVLVAYFRGMVPIPQGRFLLPVSVPLVIALTFGLRTSAYWVYIAICTALFLLAVDALNLFGNLLPYYYYGSGIVAGELTPPDRLHAWMSLVRPLYARFVADKPAWLGPIAPWLLLPYLIIAIVTTHAVWRAATSETHRSHMLRAPQWMP